jgi:hypothetical protein
MASYTKIYKTFWTDSKIDEFTADDKYLYLYLLTNPRVSLCGCYEINIKHMAYETLLSTDKVQKSIERLSKSNVVKYCKETKELLIVNWHRFNWTSSPRLIGGVRKEIETVKCPEFKQYLTGLLNQTDTVSEDFDITEYGINSTDIVIDNDVVSDKAGKSTKFIPPTVEEVRAYCRERNNTVDAETFVDFYIGKGWMVGKNKMKDWKAAVRTWEKNRKQEQSNGDRLNDFMLNYINSQEE